MLSEALPIVPFYLRKVMKHSSSNGCLSAQHTIPFPMQGGCPKAGVCIKFGRYFWQNDTVWTIPGLYILPGALLITLVYPTRVMRQSNSNGYISLEHIVIFQVRRGYLKYDILHETLQLFLVGMIRRGPQGACKCYQKLI